MVSLPNVPMRLNLAVKVSLYSHIPNWESPVIQIRDNGSSKCDKEAEEVGEGRFPRADFYFVKQVGAEYLVRIECRRLFECLPEFVLSRE